MAMRVDLGQVLERVQRAIEAEHRSAPGSVEWLRSRYERAAGIDILAAELGESFVHRLRTDIGSVQVNPLH
jgi:hypothetical protein